MGRSGSLLLKGIGALVLAFIALSVIATIVGIVFSVMATILSLAVTLAVLGVLVLAAAGLVSLLRGGSDSKSSVGVDVSTGTDIRESRDARDPKSRLQERYVAGELSEAEFERELDRLLKSDDNSASGGRTQYGTDRSRATDLDRTSR